MLASNQNCLSSGFFHHSRPLSWSRITGFLPNAFALLFLPLDLAPGVLPSYQTPLQTHRPGSELVFVSSAWGGRGCMASWVCICPAKYHNCQGLWIGSKGWGQGCLIPSIWNIPERKTCEKGLRNCCKLCRCILNTRTLCQAEFPLQIKHSPSPPLAKLIALAN